MSTQQRRLGGGSETATVSLAADKTIVKPLAASSLLRPVVARILERVDAAQLGRRVAQDCLNEAAAATWWRKADAYEWARHRPGVDYTGNATPAELAERDRKLAAQAAACRHKAELLAYHLVEEFEAL